MLKFFGVFIIEVQQICPCLPRATTIEHTTLVTIIHTDDACDIVCVFYTLHTHKFLSCAGLSHIDSKSTGSRQTKSNKRFHRPSGLDTGHQTMLPVVQKPVRRNNNGFSIKFPTPLLDVLYDFGQNIVFNFAIIRISIKHDLGQGRSNCHEFCKDFSFSSLQILCKPCCFTMLIVSLLRILKHLYHPSLSIIPYTREHNALILPRPVHAPAPAPDCSARQRQRQSCPRPVSRSWANHASQASP